MCENKFLRFYSLGRDDDDFGEQAAKKPKILKRKLSKTDKSDFKDCANVSNSFM